MIRGRGRGRAFARAMGGGAAPLALPTTGLVLHLDGDELGAVASAVATWTGLVGGDDAAQATADARPTVVTGAGGRKAASFDGGDRMTTSIVPATGSNGRTLIAVVRVLGGSGTYAHVLHYGGEGGADAYGLTSRTGGAARWGNHYWVWSWLSSAVPSGDAEIVCIGYDGTDDHLWVNGESGGTNTFACATGSGRALVLGSNHAGSAEFFTGELSAVVAYDHYLSDADRDAAFEYLADRFDITLP